MKWISSSLPFADVDEMPCNRRRRRHRRTDQVCAATLALTPFEVAIRGAGASLSRLEHVGIHREAHAASRLAPLEAGFSEYFVEPETFRLGLHFLRAWHHHRMHRWRNFVAFDDTGRGLKIAEARVGARSDKHAIDFDVLDFRARPQRHVGERALDR